MKKILLILFLFFTACVTDNGEIDNQESLMSLEPLDEIWICYNPESPEHERECSDLCHVPHSLNSFCWVLKSEDCLKSWSLEWQEKFCPMLSM